ncbi:MAG: hypothetical protein KIT22_03405 [Verrucomicrobiae bacterium]|nr:hypothetical protein [Verrucomicrobiae bacterium]
MNPSRFRTASAAVLTTASLLLPIAVEAHQPAPDAATAAGPAPLSLPVQVETRGPVRAPKEPAPAGAATSGQGFWTFAAVPDALPLPIETQPFIKGAHGTLVVDYSQDTVYWGLENIGFVGFSNRLSNSWVVRGGQALRQGNLHGADLIERRGQPPLIAAADNVEGEVYLTDTTFQNVAKLGVPDLPPYADKKGFAPTDVAFTSQEELYVTDGYGKAYVMPATVNPFAYKGTSFGGKAMSQTPHGITFAPADKSLLISARPEAQIKRWSPPKQQFLEVLGLPAGSIVCDVDLWGDYALAACLSSANDKPGALYIVNLKKRAIVSVIKPKEELGYEFAQHMHDACWYLPGKGSRQEVYVLCTAWNPGGIGALTLVTPKP